MKDKHQIIFIRWGEAFDTKEEFYDYLRYREYKPFENQKNWRDRLERSLSEKFELFAPLMPNKQSADYVAWRIRFEKIFPFIKPSKDVKLIVIGQSLGGAFLAKYLSEEDFPKKIDQLHLVSPVFDNEGLIWEKIGNFKIDPNKLQRVGPQTNHITIYHSVDDPFVPFEHSKKYLTYFQRAEFLQFQDRGHFNQPAFMEILQIINKYMP